MKKMKHLIHLLFIAGLIFTTVTACNKSEDTIGDFPSAGTLKDADGNKYNTVKIGNQVWTVENLKTTKYNDGTQMTNVTDDTQWQSIKTGAYCNYDNLESNAATYGRLYNWYAVNSDKLAPDGWHIPTDDDWNILRDYLIANGYNYDGTKDEDKIAKSLCSKSNWELSSKVGTPGSIPEDNNSTGFSALPGGCRKSVGTFSYIGANGFWWCSNEVNSSDAWFMTIFNDFEDIDIFGDYNKGYGLSIRLVKD